MNTFIRSSLITTYSVAIFVYLWAIFYNNPPAGFIIFCCLTIAIKAVCICLLTGWIAYRAYQPKHIYAFGWYAHLYTDCYRRSLRIDRYGRNLEIHWRRINIIITELPF
jgi:hypothetical protein